MKKDNLYEIDGMYQQALAEAKEQAEQNEGVIPDDLAMKLDALEMTRDIKIENSIKYYKNENAVADMLDAEIKSLQSRQRSHRSHADWLKKYLGMVMKPGEKPEYSCGKIGWRRSEALIILNPALIPDEFCKIERTPLKDAITKAIKAGTTSFGETVKIEERNNIQIK